MDPRAAKRALRRRVRALILALDPADRRAQQAALERHFPALPGLAAATTVLLYATAFPEEVATHSLLRSVRLAGQRLACPRVDRAAGVLRLHLIDDPDLDLVPGTLAIPEPRPDLPRIDPSAIDWALIPGLAFDPLGHRVGRGAGHYDRLLPSLRPDAPRWALLFDPQLVDSLPVEPHDQPLDGLACPSRLIRVGSGG